VALRFAVAAALLLVYSVGRGIPLRSGNRVHDWLTALHSVLTFCVSYGVVFWAEQWVPSSLASVLFATFPLLVAVFAHFMLPKEKMTLPVIAGTAIGFAGIAVIFAEDFNLLGGRQVFTASIVMLLSPLAGAFVSVAVKRWGSGIHPVTFNTAALGGAAAVMGVLAAIVERDRILVLAPGPIAALLYMAIVGTAVTFPLYFWLLDHMEARQVALIGYGTPIIALALGAIFLHEPFTIWTLAGSAMVVLGVALASRVWKGSG
jgi:drug/metabolite transporter (DMT)-like permease